MKRKDVLDRIEPFINPYRVTSGKKFRLSNINPDDTHGLKSESKQEAKEMLQKGVEWLGELQDKLYASDHWGVLVIFQAMDAAGKDSTIKHVMSGVNPQGCQVFSFKEPSSEELDHDFMWRYAKCMPERGRIGIFNRSYYEEVLVVRVHEELLERQKIPPALLTKKTFDHRLEFIRAYEKYLSENGILVLKFYLHVSREEQKQRFIDRVKRPDKNWKFSEHDLLERERWNDYSAAYEEAIRATATEDAPWFVVPADNKWFTRLVVAAAIVQSLENLDLSYPKVDKQQMDELQLARKVLLGQT